MINIENLTVYMKSRSLLEDTSVHISDGQKIGIVGVNGSGKSTLFRVLKGELEPTSGKINFSSNQKIAFVEQEFYDIDKTVLDFVLSKDKELVSARKKLTTCNPDELPEIYDELKRLESDTAEGRVSRILSGLGFSEDDLQKKVSDFSGGWRMRLALAGALFRYSDILLLDEPTNHLDLEASIWLENYLKKYSKTLLVISHDRNLLNNICDGIIHFENKKLVSYSGNYNNFYKNYILKHENEEKLAKKQAEFKAHLQSFVDRFRYKATKAKQAQSRLKMLDKLQDISVTQLDKSCHFEFPQALDLPTPLVKIENGSVGYDDNIVLNKININITPQDRIGILGKNGNGKSTLAKLIYGDLQLKKGSIHRQPKLNIGFFTQHQMEELPLDMSPFEYISSLLPQKTETEIRSILGNFGISGDVAITKIKDLSGGEKSRVVFTKLSLDKPSILILDEPTNHLDIQARDALIEALNNYNGAVLLITHDFNFLNMVVDDLWLVENHTCIPFNGTMDDYKKLLLSKDKDVVKKEKTIPEKDNPKPQHEQKPKHKNLQKLEEDILSLETEKSEILEKLQTPLPSSELIKLSKRLDVIETILPIRENEWLSLQEE
ncbi:MAG: ABC-F family ATP-binding cassette domain-containing protein [Alphaproteobacteria bacterium]|nr:ABC-F family ATP-binding cassette domain-containing protein [Alphaproteobacteria bacterium]